MALSNYTELQASIATRMERSDLTAQIPDFITLAEAKLNRRTDLRLANSTQSLTLASGASTIALPSGFVEPVELWLVTSLGREKLRFKAPGSLITYTTAGEPLAWTIDGANIRFDRPADAAYSIEFRMRGRYALSDASPTNDLLTDHPDAYVYAVMQEAERFMLNTTEADKYAMMLEGVLEEVKRLEGRSRSRGTLGVESHMLPRSEIEL